MIITDSTITAILRAVLEEPGVDLHRLAYADRCEELGDVERADFVRASMATEDAPPHTHDNPHDYVSGCPRCKPLGKVATWCEFLAPTVTPPLGKRTYHFGNDSDREKITADLCYRNSLAWGHACCWWRRGFIEEITLPLDAFERHAEVLFRAHPITEVRLSDREPRVISSGRFSWYWHEDVCGKPTDPYQSDDLTFNLWNGLAWHDGRRKYNNFLGYDSPESAHAALSSACVAEGRRRAGLPALTLEQKE